MFVCKTSYENRKWSKFYVWFNATKIRLLFKLKVITFIVCGFQISFLAMTINPKGYYIVCPEICRSSFKENRNALFSLYILYMPVIWNLRDGLNWTKLNRYLTFIGNAGKIVVCGMKYISKKPTSYRLKIRSNTQKNISKIMIVSSSSANYHSILKALFICAVFVACCCFDKVAHVR